MSVQGLMGNPPNEMSSYRLIVEEASPEPDSAIRVIVLALLLF